jgi:hypothetical protein
MTKAFSEILLGTLQTSDESEFHIENWHAVEKALARDEWDDTVENREPITDMRELPEDGALKRISDVTCMASNESKLDELADCNCKETTTAKFNPDP